MCHLERIVRNLETSALIPERLSNRAEETPSAVMPDSCEKELLSRVNPSL